jgi:hypothetical protein
VITQLVAEITVKYFVPVTCDALIALNCCQVRSALPGALRSRRMAEYTNDGARPIVQQCLACYIVYIGSTYYQFEKTFKFKIGVLRATIAQKQQKSEDFVLPLKCCSG